jgi:hypothetical protein
MDESDRQWLEANQAELLHFARFNYRRYGPGAVLVEAPLHLDYSTMLHAGRVRYLELSDAVDNHEVYCAVQEYDYQTEAVVIVVTDSAVPVARVQLRLV